MVSGLGTHMKSPFQLLLAYGYACIEYRFYSVEINILDLVNMYPGRQHGLSRMWHKYSSGIL